MPSPVGHLLGGYIAHVATAPGGQIASRRRTLVTLGAALAPDLDFGLKLIDGVNHHQAEGHSLGVGIALAGIVAAVAAVRRVPRAWELGLAALIGWCSHLALDLLNVDTNPPIGLMALWPLSTGYYKSPWPLFLDIGRTLDWRTVRHDVLAIAWEVVALGSLLLLVWRARARRRLGAWDGERVREQIGGGPAGDGAQPARAGGPRA